MANELKATVINMKNLSQDIADPIIVGAGDAAGRALRVIFTQEAAAQFTPSTKVYLSWWHQEKNIKGYNVFTEIVNDEEENFPPTWELHYPKSMLYEGNVLACIQIVDEISIATSVNFNIHILIDPNDGTTFVGSDDYTDFQKAVIQLTTIQEKSRKQLIDQKLEFEDMQLTFIDMKQTVADNQELATEALEKSTIAIETANETAADFVNLNEAFDNLDNKIDGPNGLAEKVAAIETNVDEKADAIDVYTKTETDDFFEWGKLS